MVSVADVLNTDVALHAVACPLPEAQVRWVATNEIPDPRPFLEGGELLLFTGLETMDWSPARWYRYAEHLREARVAALGIATGLTHADVPEGLRSACAALGVNLLAVPMETSFVSISQAVASLLEDSDRAAARDAVALQRRLAQAARRRNAADSIADELAGYVRGTVWVLSPDGRTISENLTRSDRTHRDQESGRRAATARFRRLGKLVVAGSLDRRATHRVA
ncbi:PucR family transcriptional regulator ligand-binding domain-containing protein [Saccharopolyspora pogona]|uniref:PucR family transcriptional regulator ligand-binding domain-containing protein n=1 Tax=Saccharopolyspora pogona TaxID=333966 RepID=UPI0016862B41|nr:PucR family transcriptional regulator ligand-binding domain-containing protein [Saccharopolyspora pogona]